MKGRILPIAVLLVAGPVHMQAQQQTDYTNFADTTFTINEVVVASARTQRAEVTKLNVPLNYLPVTTSRVDAGTLQTFGIQNLQDADRFLPGVRIQTSYGAFEQISVRGFDHTPIMIDGVRDERSTINNSYPFMDLSAVESIELLKGPASVLYGHSAVGGILNVVRRNAADKKTVNARLSYGSYNNKQATMGMGGKLTEGVNSYVSFHFAGQDGWRNTGNKRLSGYGVIDFKTGNKGVFDLRGGFNRDFYGTEIGLPPSMTNDVYNTDGSLYLATGGIQPGLNRKARYNNESDFMKHHGANIIATYTYAFSEAFRLEEKLSYMYDDINYFGTEELSYLTSDDPIYDHYYMSKGDKKYICLDTVQLTFPLRFSHINKTTTYQLEASGKFYTGTVTHNYLGGYNFAFIDRISYTGYVLGTNITGPGLKSKVPVNNPHSMGYMDSNFGLANVYRNYTHSIYLHDLVEFNEKLKMLLAGRFDHFNYQYARTNAIDGKRECNIPDAGDFSRILNNAFTYRAGLVYLPQPNLSLYASVGSFFQPIRTFYSPTTIYLNNKGNEFYPEENGQVFKPQSGYQAEVGARYTVNSFLTAEASIFYINKRNINKTLTTFDEEQNGETITKTVVGQVGRMDSRGLDIELTFTPGYGVKAITGYTYTHARTRELASNNYMDTDAEKGKQFTNIPPHTFFFVAGYKVEKGVLKGAGVDLNVTYRDKVYKNAANNFCYPSYWLTDLAFSYTLKNNVNLSFLVNNLFDKEYYNQSLGRQMVPSMPRNYQFAISYVL